MCVCVCVCVCEKYRKLGYGGAATTYWMMKNVVVQIATMFLSWLLFLQRLAKRLHISTKKSKSKSRDP